MEELNRMCAAICCVLGAVAICLAWGMCRAIAQLDETQEEES